MMRDSGGHLDVHGGCELGPLLPVILVKWVLDGLDWMEKVGVSRLAVSHLAVSHLAVSHLPVFFFFSLPG